MRIVILCMALAVSARADDKSAAKAAARDAQRLYDVGEFQGALDAFKKAYLAGEDGKLLFNIGECHRALGHKADAARSYRTYLKKVPAAENRSEVEALIEEMEGHRGKSPGEPPLAPPTYVPPPPVAAAPPPPPPAARASVYNPWGAPVKNPPPPVSVPAAPPPAAAPPPEAAPPPPEAAPPPPAATTPAPEAAAAPIVEEKPAGPPRKSKAWIAGVVVGVVAVLGIVIGVGAAYGTPKDAHSSLATTDVKF